MKHLKSDLCNNGRRARQSAGTATNPSPDGWNIVAVNVWSRYRQSSQNCRSGSAIILPERLNLTDPDPDKIAELCFFFFNKIIFYHIWYRNVRYCSAQARTGIGLLGKPPAVKQFPSFESHLGVRTSYATRRKRRYEANKCGWTQPFFRKARDRGIN